MSVRSTITRTHADHVQCARCHQSRRCLVLTVADVDTGGDAFSMRTGDTVAICLGCVHAAMRHTGPQPHARTRFDGVGKCVSCGVAFVEAARGPWVNTRQPANPSTCRGCMGAS